MMQDALDDARSSNRPRQFSAHTFHPKHSDYVFSIDTFHLNPKEEAKRLGLSEKERLEIAVKEYERKIQIVFLRVPFEEPKLLKTHLERHAVSKSQAQRVARNMIKTLLGEGRVADAGAIAEYHGIKEAPALQKLGEILAQIPMIEAMKRRYAEPI